MRCALCRGIGSIRVPTTPYVQHASRVDRECERCLGVGRVDSQGLARALEAWRDLRERSKDRIGLATLAWEIGLAGTGAIARSAQRSDVLGLPIGTIFDGVLFTSTDLVRDTLDEAAGGERHLYSGPAMWLGRRWLHATTDMIAGAVGGGRLTPRQHRAQRAFWSEVCPGVVDLLVEAPPELFDDRQMTMTLDADAGDKREWREASAMRLLDGVTR